MRDTERDKERKGHLKVKNYMEKDNQKEKDFGLLSLRGKNERYREG